MWPIDLFDEVLDCMGAREALISTSLASALRCNVQYGAWTVGKGLGVESGSILMLIYMVFQR